MPLTSLMNFASFSLTNSPFQTTRQERPHARQHPARPTVPATTRPYGWPACSCSTTARTQVAGTHIRLRAAGRARRAQGDPGRRPRRHPRGPGGTDEGGRRQLPRPGAGRPRAIRPGQFADKLPLVPLPLRRAADGSLQASSAGRGPSASGPFAGGAGTPHSGGPLADGQFDAKKVICPLHNYFFSLADGTCLNGDYAVRTYPVREVAGRSWSTHSGRPASRARGGYRAVRSSPACRRTTAAASPPAGTDNVVGRA